MFNTEFTPYNHVVSKPFLIDLKLLIKLGQQGASKDFLSLGQRERLNKKDFLFIL